MTVITMTGANRVITRIANNPDLLQELSLLAMDVNDHAGYPNDRVARTFFANGLASTEAMPRTETDKSVISPSSP